MSPNRKPTNVAASVRARLLNLGRQRGEEFQLVLSDFATERFLYRLSVSPYADRFILKRTAGPSRADGDPEGPGDERQGNPP